jgi:hypothetical protein
MKAHRATFKKLYSSMGIKKEIDLKFKMDGREGALSASTLGSTLRGRKD